MKQSIRDILIVIMAEYRKSMENIHEETAISIESLYKYRRGIEPSEVYETRIRSYYNQLRKRRAKELILGHKNNLPLRAS